MIRGSSAAPHRYHQHKLSHTSPHYHQCFCAVQMCWCSCVHNALFLQLSFSKCSFLEVLKAAVCFCTIMISKNEGTFHVCKSNCPCNLIQNSWWNILHRGSNESCFWHKNKVVMNIIKTLQPMTLLETSVYPSLHQKLDSEALWDRYERIIELTFLTAVTYVSCHTSTQNQKRNPPLIDV